MDQQVEDFFLQYASANSSSDVEATGRFYADTFMFGGINGVQAVKKEDFLRVIPKLKDHLSSMGLAETRIQSVQASPLSSKYLLATVAWKITVRNSAGTKQIDALATYVLMRGPDDALSIVFQIDHQDLATAVKDLQNA